jgi:hypothetical protein
MRAFIIAGVLALAACDPAPQSEAPAPQQTVAEASGACGTSASSTWSGLNIEAVSAGDDCGHANATITIRDASGASLHSAAYPTDQVMVLAGAGSVDELQRMLSEWITPAGAMKDSTADLPDWLQGQDQPADGEFPFFVEEGMDRASYNALRQRDAPLYCYVQGMESLACLVYENGAVTNVGVQTFPG